MAVAAMLIFVGAIRQPMADGLDQEDTISCVILKSSVNLLIIQHKMQLPIRRTYHY